MSPLYFLCSLKQRVKMCDYVAINKCKISGEICPFIYFCTKVNAYTPMPSMPKHCKVAKGANIPVGTLPVRMCRKNQLYVDIDGQTKVFNNPFNFIPLWVRIEKDKEEIKIKDGGIVGG